AGAQQNTEALAASVASAKNAAMVRQSVTRSAISSGTVTVIAPRMPTAKARELTLARRSFGYHSANAWNEPIRHTETPRPTRARPRMSQPNERASANARRRRGPPAAARDRRGAGRSGRAARPSGTGRGERGGK